MNFFNRMAMVVLLVVFIVAVVAFSLQPRLVVDLLVANLTSLRTGMDQGLDLFTQIGLAVGGLIVAAGGFVLLLAELRPKPRQSVVVSDISGGRAELSNDSVAMRIKRTAEAVEGIREASPAVKSRGKAIDILLALVTEPDIDIPEKTQEVMQAVRAESETKMGVPVKNLRVTVKHGGKELHFSNPLAGLTQRRGNQS